MSLQLQVTPNRVKRAHWTGKGNNQKVIDDNFNAEMDTPGADLQQIVRADHTHNGAETPRRASIVHYTYDALYDEVASYFVTLRCPRVCLAALHQHSEQSDRLTRFDFDMSAFQMRMHRLAINVSTLEVECGELRLSDSRECTRQRHFRELLSPKVLDTPHAHDAADTMKARDGPQHDDQRRQLHLTWVVQPNLDTHYEILVAPACIHVIPDVFAGLAEFFYFSHARHLAFEESDSSTPTDGHMEMSPSKVEPPVEPKPSNKPGLLPDTTMLLVLDSPELLFVEDLCDAHASGLVVRCGRITMHQRVDPAAFMALRCSFAQFSSFICRDASASLLPGGLPLAPNALDVLIEPVAAVVEYTFAESGQDHMPPSESDGNGAGRDAILDALATVNAAAQSSQGNGAVTMSDCADAAVDSQKTRVNRSEKLSSASNATHEAQRAVQRTALRLDSTVVTHFSFKQIVLLQRIGSTLASAAQQHYEIDVGARPAGARDGDQGR